MLVNLEQAIKLRALQQMHNGVGFDNNAMRWYLMMINEEILVRDGKCKRIDGGCVYVCDSA